MVGPFGQLGRMVLLRRVRTLVTTLVVSALLSAPVVNAQGGVRAIFWDYEVVDGSWLSGYGLGFDHDMNERLSMGLQVRYSGPTLQADYRSAFHFSENDRSSFYLGPQCGLRSFLEEEDLVFPIGLRTGVRGGLRGFYADLFASVSYSLGDRAGYGADTSASLPAVDASPVSFNVGLHMGIGWDRADR